jgi:ABC-type multidrug transport system fused ATPase/permease subunit
MLLRGAGTATIGTAFLFYTSWQLAIVSCLTLLPIALISKFYGSYVKLWTKKKLDALGLATASAQVGEH